MKKLFTLILLAGIAIMHAQDTVFFHKPDFKAIEKRIKDKNSPLYFERLYSRFAKADSTMTQAERQHLYYGYSFKEGYNPYFTSEASLEISKLLNIDNLGKKDMEKIISLSDEVLKGYPFNLSMMGYRAYFFSALGRQKEAAAENTRANIILDAILGTGDGLDKSTCMYVINVGNEYEVINILGFAYGGNQKFVDARYDYLELEENEQGVQGLYFDVSRIVSTFK